MRKIVHIDMDAFYASVEQRDNPELRGKALAVGFDGPRGVVMTASYEARQFGVGSAMHAAAAKARCPNLLFVRPRMSVYRDVSQQIREVFFSYTDLVEPLSLDEAYLDVTDPKQGPLSATLLAQQIKQDIVDAVSLTASAGVAANKFLAKSASGQNKPDGLTVITPDKADAFLAALPIGKFHGIGPKTATKMQQMGIHTGADLRNYSKDALEQRFGKNGVRFWQIAQGIDDRPVNPNREHKSISSETTFTEDLADYDALALELPPLAEHVAKSLAKYNLVAGGVSLKVKYSNHQIITRRQTLPNPVSQAEVILTNAERLLRTRVPLSQPVRLLGVGVFSMTDADARNVEQLSLFESLS
jgi:DNA polymerase-4